MAFGGAVKLTGESDYRRALKQITQELKTTSTALKSQATDFNANSKAQADATTREKALTAAINEQKNALTNAQRTLAQYTVSLTAQQTRHNALTREYKAAVLELDRIKEASGETSDEYKKQAEVVGKLEGELAESTDELNRNKQAMGDLKREINSASRTINDAEGELEDLGDSAKKSGEDAKEAGDGFTTFKGVVANLASTAITAAVSGLKKLGGALVDVGKQSVTSYAQYEQLVGGVETLFKESADEVKGYADIAYKTAGMSANTYMETVTSFSASLLQGLGGDTAKAAKIADMAIIDMSDNANKMGTSMDMIQNAYQGFAKQNYTMLDNLKLGYGGTKAEMARLVKESGVLGKAGKDLTAKNLDQKVSFDQIIKAVHKVQQRMGIAGTTSKEAADTIEGSAGSMGAAWENVLTAMADKNADLGKSVDIFVSSAITAGKNLVPKIRTVVDSIKKMIGTIVTEVFPKLKKEVPELKPLIETFEWFIKNKNLVIGAIKAMITAFAVKKIWDFTKGMSDAAKSVIDFVKNTLLATAARKADTAAEVVNTGAKVAGTAATGGLTVAQNALNAAMSANPIGLVIGGIAALIGVISALTGNTEELTEAEKAEQEALEAKRQAIEDTKNAWADLEKEQQNSINTGMTEVANLSNLYDELGGIVDQNGKVKEGYEERAEFITTTLADALGLEIQYVDGVVKGYDKIKNGIDEIIEKKRAKIVLDSQESLYAEAIKKQEEAVKNLSTAEEDVQKKEIELGKLRSDAAGEQAKADEAAALARANASDTYLQNLASEAQASADTAQKKADDKQKELDDAEDTYNELLDIYNNYAYNIGTYEDNLAKFHAGKYDEMTTATWEYVKEYKGAGDAEKKMLEDKLKITNARLETLKKLRKDNNTTIYNDQIAAAKKEKTALESQLKAYVDTTDAGLKGNKVKWSKNLAAQLSDITGHDVKFKDAGKGNVQMYVDGEKTGEKKSKKAMADMVTQTIKEITKKDKDAKKAGEDLIDGVNNGIKNQDKQSGVFKSIANFGSTLLSKLKTSLKEKSPSKATEEMGKFLLQGLNVGIKKEQASVYKQVEKFSNNLLKKLKTTTDYKTAGANLIKSFDKGVENAIKASQNKVSSTIKASFQKQLNTLKDQNAEIRKLYNDIGKTATKEFNSAIQAATEGVTDKLQARIKTLTEKLQAKVNEINTAIANMRTKLADYGDLYVTDQNGNVALTDINQQTKTLKKYSSNLNKLKGKISDSLMQEITKMDVDDAIKYTNELLKLSSTQLKEYDKVFTAKQKQAAKIAKAFYSEQLKEIKTEYTDKIKAEFKSAKKEIKNIGKQTMQGFIKGMQSVNYTKDIKAIANNLVKQMKKALGIKSPSKVFADQVGKNAALGIEQGFIDEMPSVTKAMQGAIPTQFDTGFESAPIVQRRADNNRQENLISAFMTALSQMKIELDDEVAGKFVENTVTRVIYT